MLRGCNLWRIIEEVVGIDQKKQGGMPFSPAVERSENLVSRPPKLLLVGNPQYRTTLYIYI
ncbi:hypothetical protein [Calothrix rhizosoleniae]|uniref:hypothetical protein n=1 Tax=Calothrix rhizosoleniae TaxID=888997 RepID=UPI000B4A4492|nr:hypothetical protein [Calothrix rhizosoleniae]